MTTSLSFFILISGLLNEANEAAHQAEEACADQPIAFAAPQIEAQLRCTITGMPPRITLSNATEQNQYGSSESLLTLQFKLKP